MNKLFKSSLVAIFLLLINLTAWADGETPVIANWQFTSSWYFGLLPDYEVIQPIKLLDQDGNDVTFQCLNNVVFTSSDETSISVSRVSERHNSGMTGYWKLKAGQTKGNATVTATYNGDVLWNQTASTPFTVFCGDPADQSWLQNNMFGIDPILVYANAGEIVQMPTIVVNGNRNVLTDFDILYVRSSNPDNVEVIKPEYNNAGVLQHGYLFKVKQTKATRIWIEIKGKGQFTGYWAKIYFNINGLTVSHGGAVNGQDGQGTGDAADDPNADPIITPEGETPEQGGGEGGQGTTPTNPTTYTVKIPVPNYVLASGQTIHQTPAVIKTEKNGENLTTNDVTSYYTFSYTCDRPEYAYVAADGTVTALQEIKEPIYINVKATPTATGVNAGCKETSTSYSVQIYSSESVIRLNPTALTIPMMSATEGEQRLVPSIIMKVNGVVYNPNEANTFDLSYEGFDPSIVALVDAEGKVQGENDDFNMVNVMYFKALKAGTTQGIVHARGKGLNSGFWGTAPFSITVTPYVPTAEETPSETTIREISIPVPFYTMAYGNTIRLRIKVKEYADAEAKKNNVYTDVTDQYTLSYSSSNNQIASVDATGLVTAVAENVNPAYIKVVATPVSEAPAVNPTSFGVKVFGGASVISPSRKNISLAPGEIVPTPAINVVVDGVQYSTEDAFNLHYDITTGTDKAEVITNNNIRGLAVGNATCTVTLIGKGAFEGFYGTTQFEIIVRQSETLNGANTWYWAQDGARSAIYDLYPGKQLHFEFTNKTIDAGKDDAGWTFVASKTPGYSDQAFLAANPFANLMTWDGWGDNANPQPVVTLNDGTFDLSTYKSDLKNAKVDYIVALDADGKTLSINATIEAKDNSDNTIRTYTYTIAKKQLSYNVDVLPVYFSSVRSTIETLRLVPQTYTVNAKVSGEGGSVKIMVNGEEKAGTPINVEEGSHVVVMAVPNGYDQAGGSSDRYYFVNWQEDNSTNITRDFYIDHDITLTATFRKDEKKWLDVTIDGQDYLLNKDNYENDYFFKVKYGDEVHYPEKKWDDIALLQQKLTTLYSHEVNGINDHHIDLYVRGAKAFKVYAYDANDVESEYTVKVDNGEAQTVTHHGKSLEASQIFKIDSPVDVGTEGETVNTITLVGNDNQLYPFLVQFFTKAPILQTANRQYLTLADGYHNDPILASELASAGTLTSVTYLNKQDEEIATAEINNDGNLVVTGYKAGNILVKLNFTGDDTHSAASFDYSIIVKKRDIRMSWSKKAENIRKGDDTSINARLSYYEIGLNGDTLNIMSTTTPPDGIDEINYASTNPSIFTWDWRVKLGDELGTADLIARIDETDQVMASKAVISINVTEQLSGASYDVGTDTELMQTPDDGKKDDMIQNENAVASFDLHVYKYNNKLTGTKGKELKDIWGKVKEYQGSDAMKKVWYLDGFSYNTQGNQNAMNEKFRSETATDYKISFVGEGYQKVQPFSLPVRGSFVKFDALKSGVLTTYVLQNGNLNFNHISEYESHKNNPISKNPRLYYWFDQEGNNMQSVVTATTKQPLAIGRRDDLPKLTEMLTDTESGYADPAIQQMYSEFPIQWDVDRNMEKETPDAQPIIQYHGGYSIMNKAYVKYEVPIKAGYTYYFFSNDSKVAFSGVTFKENSPSAQAKASKVDNTLTLDEANDDWASDDMQQYKGQTFEHVTLSRSFTKNQWNTICLPINVSEKQVEKVFGVGTQLLIYDGINSDGVAMFLRHVDQNILAGQPYFIYATGVDARNNDTDGNITSLDFTNVTVPSDLQVRSYGNDDVEGLKMIGTLSKTDVAKYDYYVNAKTGAITRYTGIGTKLNAYRAFLQQTNSTQAKMVNFGFTDIESEAENGSTGTPTGLFEVINELGVGQKHIPDGIYNINGMKVGIKTEDLDKGVYIKDGKKFTK